MLLEDERSQCVRLIQRVVSAARNAALVAAKAGRPRSPPRLLVARALQTDLRPSSRPAALRTLREERQKHRQAQERLRAEIGELRAELEQSARRERLRTRRAAPVRSDFTQQVHSPARVAAAVQTSPRALALVVDRAAAAAPRVADVFVQAGAQAPELHSVCVNTDAAQCTSVGVNVTPRTTAPGTTRPVQTPPLPEPGDLAAAVRRAEAALAEQADEELPCAVDDVFSAAHASLASASTQEEMTAVLLDAFTALVKLSPRAWQPPSPPPQPARERAPLPALLPPRMLSEPASPTTPSNLPDSPAAVTPGTPQLPPPPPPPPPPPVQFLPPKDVCLGVEILVDAANDLLSAVDAQVCALALAPTREELLQLIAGLPPRVAQSKAGVERAIARLSGMRGSGAFLHGGAFARSDLEALVSHYERLHASAATLAEEKEELLERLERLAQRTGDSAQPRAPLAVQSAQAILLRRRINALQQERNDIEARLFRARAARAEGALASGASRPE